MCWDGFVIAEPEIMVNNNLPNKTCNQCGLELPLSMFSKNSGARHYRAKCKNCEKHQRQQRMKFRDYRPPDNHVCPICQKDEEQCRGKGGYKSGTWCLDHDHKTGKFRGWLCHECNRALGNFKDSENLLESALHYLRDSR